MNKILLPNPSAHSLVVNRMLPYSEISVVIRAEDESVSTGTSSVVKLFTYLHTS